MADLTISRFLYRRTALYLLLSRLTWRLVPAVVVLCLLVSLLLTGVLVGLPLPWHLLILLLAVGIFSAALTWAFRDARLPSRQAVERRIEQASRLAHQPFQALRDEPAAAVPEQAWEKHHRQVSGWVARARLRSGGLLWPKERGKAGRIALLASLLLVLLTGMLQQGQGGKHFRQSLYPSLQQAALPSLQGVRLRYPLQYGRDSFLLQPAQPVLVPVGTTLHRPAMVRRGISWHLDGSLLAGTPVVLDKPGTLRVRYLLQDVTPWPVKVVPDKAPVITWSEEPQLTPNGTIGIGWQLEDDFGVRSLRVNVYDANGKRLRSLPLQQWNGTETSSRMVRYVQRAALVDSGEDGAKAQTIKLSLRVRDMAGNIGHSGRVSLPLPAHQLKYPLAIELDNAAKALPRDPTVWNEAPVALRRMGLELPATPYNTGSYLGMRAAAARLQMNSDTAPVVAQQLEGLAWQIDRDNQPQGQLESVRRAQEQLQQALQQGDTQAAAAAMRALEQALQRYMEKVMQTMGANGMAGAPMPPAGQGQAPWQSSLDAVRDLLASGQTAEAMKALQQMQAMMENMSFQPADPEAVRKAMEQQQRLQETLRQQTALLDRTARQAKSAQQTMQALHPLQQRLQQQTAAQSQDVPKAIQHNLKAAARQMDMAADALKDNDVMTAVASQTGAVASLRKALGNMQQQQGKTLAPSMQNGVGGGSWFQRSNEQVRWQQQGNTPLRSLFETIHKRLEESHEPAEREYLEKLLRTEP